MRAAKRTARMAASAPSGGNSSVATTSESAVTADAMTMLFMNAERNPWAWSFGSLPIVSWMKRSNVMWSGIHFFP